MKYTAFNIGPIVKTLELARKPRELWAASFIFSQLMKHIYAEVENNNKTIISPSKPTAEKLGVGIYPDRIFVKGEIDAPAVINSALSKFEDELKKTCYDIDTNSLERYINVMATSIEAKTDSEAIDCLNKRLDIMELCQYANDGDTQDAIYNILHNHNEHLMSIAGADKSMFWNDLEDIAKTNQGDSKELSLHRYICIVQADGDNVGKTVSNKNLKDGDVEQISKELVKFGIDATRAIKEFGGMPIYAGGDDLLFIAPVAGKDNKNIFDLIQTLQDESFKNVHERVKSFGLKDDEGQPIEASLSFGIAITYHKYPLYEAFETARNLLFDHAKKIKNKKAVAWTLRKHSGGSFDAVFSCKDNNLWKEFQELIAATNDGNTVSAVAHKLRQNESLVNIVVESNEPKRLDALFDKLLEFDSTKSEYFNAVKTIMPSLYNVVGKERYIQSLYSILRTAKFIKGEDLRDE